MNLVGRRNGKVTSRNAIGKTKGTWPTSRKTHKGISKQSESQSRLHTHTFLNYKIEFVFFNFHSNEMKS